MIERPVVPGADRARAVRIREERARAERGRVLRQQRPPAPTGPTAGREPTAGSGPAARRRLTLRVNRLINTAAVAAGLVVVIIGALGVFRAVTHSFISGLILIVFAVAAGVVVGRRLGAGRLLVLEVTTGEVRLTNAGQPEVVIERSPGLRVVIWLAPRYRGAAPSPRGLYLVDHEAVRSFSRPLTFSAERMRRFFTAADLPLELIEATDPPLALTAARAG